MHPLSWVSPSTMQTYTIATKEIGTRSGANPSPLSSPIPPARPQQCAGIQIRHVLLKGSLHHHAFSAPPLPNSNLLLVWPIRRLDATGVRTRDSHLPTLPNH